jgi:hypothetical protein
VKSFVMCFGDVVVVVVIVSLVGSIYVVVIYGVSV